MIKGMTQDSSETTQSEYSHLKFLDPRNNGLERDFDNSVCQSVSLVVRQLLCLCAS